MHEDDINVSSNKTIFGRLLRIRFAGIYKLSLAQAATFEVKQIFFLSQSTIVRMLDRCRYIGQ
jgi:hypothetical protein